MRKIYYFFLGSFVLFIITSATFNANESTQLYEKIVFLEFDVNQDSILFKPLSKAWGEQWNDDADLTVDGSALMNYEKYQFSFNERKENLWTILHPMIIKGSIQSYYPFDPTFGFGPSDEGELRYPIVDKVKKETFVNSLSVRENLSYRLGRYGSIMDYPLITQFGEDSVKILADGTVSYVYPPRDYYWYIDEDIAKYKMRVSVLLNKNGVEKKRVIESICPIVYRIDDANEIIGEDELIWLNFQEITPALKKAYFFNEEWKPQSYLNYILEKVKNADLKAIG